MCKDFPRIFSIFAANIKKFSTPIPHRKESLSSIHFNLQDMSLKISVLLL